MAIPLTYNLRNLVVRKTTTLMTALGIALTVAVLLAILAMVDGLRTALATSGDPLHVLVMRKGSESEIVSNVLRAQFQDLKFKSGIASGHDGQPLAGKIRSAWEGILEDAGLDEDVVRHTLRHTAATWLMQQGTDLWEAAGWLGMTVEQLEENYGHHHPDFQNEAAQAFGGRR